MDHKKMMERKIENKVHRDFPKFVKFVFMVLFGIAFAILAIYILMRLWNWLMPDIFGLTIITYWQALGLFVLAKIIFGLGNGGPNKGSHKSKKGRRNQKKCGPNRKEFSEWELYDQFWKEEGEKAFKAYAERNKNNENDVAVEE